MAASFVKKIWLYVFLWLFSIILALSALAFFERQSLVRELTVKSEILQRLASQRADQHDAHLTSLSAVFVTGGIEREDLLLDVARTITRFYPRITSVNVIPFNLSEPTIETQPGVSIKAKEQIIDLARHSTGALQMGPMPNLPHHYLLVKRTPNSSAAQHGLALVVDARKLIATDDPFWQTQSASLSLAAPDNQIASAEQFSIKEAGFSKPLSSASQPLILNTSLMIDMADILPLGKVFAAIAAITAVFGVAALGLRQRTRTKDAETRAQLSAQETRLAHASRVNAMGEMASGMAHELAQPLTAILSQAQAGRHLSRRGDLERLNRVLDETVSQAQRAANILDRLRRWSKPNRRPSKACSVHDAVRNVQNLLATEVKAKGALMVLSLHDEPLFINADPVELEQVVFNLVRNALDASDAARIEISTYIEDHRIVLDVADNGPGIRDDIKAHIFEPFVTSKRDGTGLGLALCQRLVDEMDGNIMLLDNVEQTTFRLCFLRSNVEVKP